MAAFGGHGILVPVRRSAGVTAGAWKASAGALARVRVAQASNLAQALAAYQQAGLFVVGLDAGGAADIGDLQLADSPLVLVVGGEGRGLSRLITERCDAVARIPITGGRVAQRRRGGQHRPVRGVPPARLTCRPGLWWDWEVVAP